MEGFNVSEKVLKYESFVNDVLKQDLAKYESQLDGVNTEIAEYLELKNMIRSIEDANLGPSGFKTKIDIGCNFYMQANVEDPFKVFVDIGLGNFVELTRNEAMKFLDMRIDLLTKKAHIIQSESAKAKSHIKLVLHGIAELQNLSMTEEKT